MKGLRLYKKEKLCSAIAIEQLFGNSADTPTHGALAYPLRAVWRENPARHSDAPIAFLISVPKRRLRHAVDRVTIRRRIREAYRLHHQDFNLPQGSRIDLAFVYVGNGLTSYAAVEKAMLRLLADVEKTAAQ